MSFWSVLKKIGSVALPIAGIAAAPLTGGGSLALLGLGAAGGAAGGALSGGVKGALMGGALGAIPGIGQSTGLIGSAASGASGALGATSDGIPNIATTTGLAGGLASGASNPSIWGSIGKDLLSANTLGAIGSLASGAAAGDAAAKQQGYNNAVANYQLKNNQYQQTLENSAKYPLAFSNQIRNADILQNYKSNAPDVFAANSWSNITKAMAEPTYTMSDQTKAALAEWQRQSINSLFNPTKAPVVPDVPTASTADNILSGVGLGADALAALRGYKLPATTTGRG